MVGASSTVAGGRGIVPVPAIGDNSKLLTGAGTWGTSLIAKRAFTSGTTYTPTSGTNKIICYVIGGGGGGGACIASINTTQGSGGAAGAVVGFVESVSDQTTYTYSIGGAGASSTIGGNTSIVVNGNTYTSNGGNPGTDGSGNAPSVSGGGVGGTTAPGVVTGNAFLIADGGVGGYGAAMGSNVHASGQGGSNMFGSGGRSAVTNAAGSSVGTAGNGFGAGGSGARQNNSTAVAGGAGSGGAIIIFEIR